LKDKIFENLQKLGRTFMLPISLLPIAGLFMGIGASFTSSTFVEQYGLEAILGEGTILYGFLQILNQAGAVIFDNLGLFFAMGIAIGMAKNNKGVAALSGVVGYFMMYASMTSAISNFRDAESLSEIPGLITNVLGFENTMNVGVFGGIIVGLIVYNLHNRFYKIKLPDALAFFGGTHFVPIISAVAGVALGISLAFIWPFFALAISALGQWIAGTGELGIFLYSYIYRILIPFGLHHIFYLPFWQTAVGGTEMVAGEMVEGAQNIVFSQLSAGVPVSSEFARFFSFQFPIMLFGLPAAALAMYTVAKDKNKSNIKGLLSSSAFASILTGITEPLEFTILFASPLLYFGVHCVLFAFSGILVSIFEVGVGFTFSGGLIDFILYGVLQGNARTNWIPIIFIGIAYFIGYFLMFRFVIKKFDLNTPGRKDENELKTKDDYVASKETEDLSEDEKKAYNIVSGLGGTNNLVDVDNCATRLRVTVDNGEKVNNDLLKNTGAAGVVVRGSSVQAVYGTTVSTIKTDVDELIDSGRAPKEGRKTESEQGLEEDQVVTEDNEELSEGEGWKNDLFSAAAGNLIQLEDIEDEVFSSKMMGDGFAVRPDNGEIVSPIDGEISNVFPAKHAIGIQTDSGLEVLVHMGLDTVELKGEGFEVHVSEGDVVEAGATKIATMDLDTITNNGKGTEVIVIMTNMDKVQTIDVKEPKEVVAGEPIGTVTAKDENEDEEEE